MRKHVAGAVEWKRIVRPRLTIVGSVYVIDRPIVFDAIKDKPVILSAIVGKIGCVRGNQIRRITTEEVRRYDD